MKSMEITAVGIDVSKRKSTVAIRRPGGVIVACPFDISHSSHDLEKLVSILKTTGGDIRVVMEHTSNYWKPIALTLKNAGFYVSVVNAMLIHDFSDNSIDAPPFQSGNFESKSRHVSKRGSPHLRRTVFLVANIILTLSHKDNSVFCFMDKKRAEGKHYYVYTIAGSAKFLRIYYARVSEYLRTQEPPAAAICLDCKD